MGCGIGVVPLIFYLFSIGLEVKAYFELRKGESDKKKNHSYRRSAQTIESLSPSSQTCSLFGCHQPRLGMPGVPLAGPKQAQNRRGKGKEEERM